jgi:hypothetical protein
MTTAASISRKLGQEFTRESFSGSGQVKGWGTLTPGFSVKTEEKKVVVRWIGHHSNQDLKNAKVDEIAAYLVKQNIPFTLETDWRGNKIVIGS